MAVAILNALCYDESMTTPYLKAFLKKEQEKQNCLLEIINLADAIADLEDELKLKRAKRTNLFKIAYSYGITLQAIADNSGITRQGVKSYLDS